MQKIVTFLWFDDQAEAAAEFYTSVFPNSKITDVQRYGEAGPGTAGSVMVVTFELDGQEYMALNGGPQFTFSEAISLYVRCETQEEVDELWEKLSEGGEKGPCGWLKDKFGLSWQIVPNAMMDLIGSSDTRKAQGAMKAMLGMTKLDVAELRRAYDQA
ncbi:VOC family protein [Amycolatopsis pigmentata]|uniref:VOC family protein n=1 Tax=Amycolatopsis pigmentata TaxID=450801 RepID=A0ABW5FXV0_9PSEU